MTDAGSDESLGRSITTLTSACRLVLKGMTLSRRKVLLALGCATVKKNAAGAVRALTHTDILVPSKLGQ